MNSPTPTIDMQSVNGSAATILLCFISYYLPKFNLSYMDLLQALAYVATITVAVDTLTGNYIKKSIVNAIKKLGKNESKR